MTTLNPRIDLFSIYGPPRPDGWLMSDWNAGQTWNMAWEEQNVRQTASGDVELILGAAPAGSSRPFNGGEIQSAEVATTGTWSWTAQAPRMVDGAVFGMFTYRADWQFQPWVEFDFEFVGHDTTKVQLNIHMEDAAGHHISLDQAKGGSIIVDLGFDAAQGMHNYDVAVSNDTATFRVDGRVVGTYGRADMPGGVWQIGPQKSFVDLWCATGLDHWTGPWNYDGTPLVARVQGGDVRPGDLTGIGEPVFHPVPLEGDNNANTLTGTPGDDTMYGRGGDDTITGGSGNDTLSGGEGNDVLRLAAGNDLLDGDAGSDWIGVIGSTGARIDLALTAAQDTGFGSDTLRNVENIAGGSGNDILGGNDGANVIRGGAGNDVLSGRGGADMLVGGAGSDALAGGDGNDRLWLGAGDDRVDGGAGSDWILVGGVTGARIDLTLTGPQDTGQGRDTILDVEHVSGGGGNDSLTGDAGANVLKGNAGDDVLAGGAGADTLNGGAGHDVMSGGSDLSRNVFVFAATTDSAPGPLRDVILDFTSGTDVINLRGIDADTTRSGDQAFAFGGSTATAFGVWTVGSGPDTLVLADVDGDAVADLEVLLGGVTTVAAGDILF